MNWKEPRKRANHTHKIAKERESSGERVIERKRNRERERERERERSAHTLLNNNRYIEINSEGRSQVCVGTLYCRPNH